MPTKKKENLQYIFGLVHQMLGGKSKDYFFHTCYGGCPILLFGLREEGGLEGSKVKLIENRLIWVQFYSTSPSPPPQSKQTISEFISLKYQPNLIHSP